MHPTNDSREEYERFLREFHGKDSLGRGASGEPACDLDTRKFVERLREAGAYLPQPELSRTMTR